MADCELFEPVIKRMPAPSFRRVVEPPSIFPETASVPWSTPMPALSEVPARVIFVAQELFPEMLRSAPRLPTPLPSRLRALFEIAIFPSKASVAGPEAPEVDTVIAPALVEPSELEFCKSKVPSCTETGRMRVVGELILTVPAPILINCEFKLIAFAD